MNVHKRVRSRISRSHHYCRIIIQSCTSGAYRSISIGHIFIHTHMYRLGPRDGGGRHVICTSWENLHTCTGPCHALCIQGQTMFKILINKKTEWAPAFIRSLRQSEEEGDKLLADRIIKAAHDSARQRDRHSWYDNKQCLLYDVCAVFLPYYTVSFPLNVRCVKIHVISYSFSVHVYTCSGMNQISNATLVHLRTNVHRTQYKIIAYRHASDKHLVV